MIGLSQEKQGLINKERGEMMRNKKRSRVFAALAAVVLGVCIALTGCQKKGEVDKSSVARGFDEEGDIHYFDEQAVALAGEAQTSELMAQAEATHSIVNQKRAAAGLGPLDWSEPLSEAAMVRAKECETSFSHKRPNGQDWYTVNSQIMYGENLAHNYTNANSVVDAWMASPTALATVTVPVLFFSRRYSLVAMP